MKTLAKILALAALFAASVSMASCKHASSPDHDWTGGGDNPPAPAATFTVTFKAGDGSGDDYTQTFTEGVAQSLSACTFAAPSDEDADLDYFLDYWEDGDGKKYENKQSIKVGKNLTLTAKWILGLEVENSKESIGKIDTVLSTKPAGTYKVKAAGSFGEEITGAEYSVHNDFQKAFVALDSNNENVKVKLDLSGLSDLKTIGDSAFENCKSLASVTIPDGVTSIGEGAFYCCESLASIVFEGDTPPSIGTDAFSYIKSDAKIYVPDDAVGEYQTALNFTKYADKVTPISERPAN